MNGGSKMTLKSITSVAATSCIEDVFDDVFGGEAETFYLTDSAADALVSDPALVFDLTSSDDDDTEEMEPVKQNDSLFDEVP